jgi:hypothetical protein
MPLGSCEGPELLQRIFPRCKSIKERLSGCPRVFESDRFQGTKLHKSPTITHFSRSISTKAKLDQAAWRRECVSLSSAFTIRPTTLFIGRTIKSFHPANTKEACVRTGAEADGTAHGRTLHPVSEQPKSMCESAQPPRILFIAQRERGAPDKPWQLLAPRIIKIVRTARRGIISRHACGQTLCSFVLRQS